jgi:hypothetical protein
VSNIVDEIWMILHRSLSPMMQSASQSRDEDPERLGGFSGAIAQADLAMPEGVDAINRIRPRSFLTGSPHESPNRMNPHFSTISQAV